MPPKNQPAIEAFIDKSFPVGKVFCTKFLCSHEFNTVALKSLVKSNKNQKKNDLAESVAASLENQSISAHKILVAFVQQPRKWLSFKIGNHEKCPTLKDASQLLTEFGEDGWYGPIIDSGTEKKWYIRTHRIPYPERGIYQAGERTEGEIIAREAKQVSSFIRWTVIAELGENYVALSWNNFRFKDSEIDIADPRSENLVQFPYWKYIDSFFDELTSKCKSDWKHPVLHRLILQNIWDKYIDNSSFTWRHLRIRADNCGVALNAHSTGAFDSEKMKGLQALAKQLASSALKSLGAEETTEVANSVENALLRTLIKEWGTKSYEFSLDQVSGNGQKSMKVFRAHCYFAIGTSPSPQDSLQHLLCFIGDYGGSSQTLQFLLSEIERLH
jgi:hypothetical protein